MRGDGLASIRKRARGDVGATCKLSGSNLERVSVATRLRPVKSRTHSGSEMLEDRWPSGWIVR
jgi:hypothetical protein